MLSEWLESLWISCPRSLRVMGYLRELRNIQKRHELWGGAWAEHLERTRAVIREAMSRCREHRKAVILGSGLLHDVPLAELSAAFREVILVDIVHPLATRRRVRGFANVRLLAADVTGVVASMYRVASVPGAALPWATPSLPVDDGEVDLVASVNLLSQLPCMPERYLHHRGAHSGEAIAAFAREVIRAHVDFLSHAPGVAALISDVESLTVSTAGRVLRRTGTLYGIELPWRGEGWTWPLVPRGLVYPHHASHLAVVGIPDVKHAPLAAASGSV
jgi:hypothetical protein